MTYSNQPVGELEVRRRVRTKDILCLNIDERQCFLLVLLLANKRFVLRMGAQYMGHQVRIPFAFLCISGYSIAGVSSTLVKNVLHISLVLVVALRFITAKK